jgi:DNA-binding response OmpR family regulator
MRSLCWLLATTALASGCRVAQSSLVTEADALKQALAQIEQRDQQIRTVILAVGMDLQEATPLFQQMRQTGSVNQVNVRHLLATYGWPARSQVGEAGARTIFLVVQHSDRAFIAQQLPALRRLVKRGEANPTYAALMEDRLRIFSGRKQRYGTQTADWVRHDGTLVIWPIQRPAQVNQRRQRFGFATTVEQNAAQLGAQYNPHEHLPSPRVIMP